MTTDTSTGSTDHDTRAATTPTKKAPGRPRKGSELLSAAERQRAYKARQKAQAQQLQREAQDVTSFASAANYPLADPAGAAAAQQKLLALPAQVLLRALAGCINDLESGNTDHHDLARSVARRVFVTLTEKYDLNREDDEIGTVGRMSVT